MSSTLALHLIDPSPNQHRKHFGPAAMSTLRKGIEAAGGILQPILVRPMPGRRFEIIAGERRWRIARELYADQYEMPVLIREASDAEAEALGLIENYHRDNPSLAEQARSAARLLYLNRGDKAETALQLGWTADALERRLLLLACSDAALDALTQRRIALGHAELLAGLPHERQDKVLAGVLEHKVPVDVLKKQLGQFARRLSDAIFDTQGCAGCPHNSARQSGLFDEALGDGYCQHPSHFDELTEQALQARAEVLKDRYQVIRIVKGADGFTPLHVEADGELGVGPQQYAACQGCAHFGCSLSAVPGSYGEQTDSLCFDPACHSRKVGAQRQARRAAKNPLPLPSTHTQPSEPVSQQTPPRVAQYRTELWRKWAARSLMADTRRNACVLAALALSSRVQVFDAQQFAKAANVLLGSQQASPDVFEHALAQTDQFAADRLPDLALAVTASAAFRIDPSDLTILLNFLAVDEARHFTLTRDYLDLLTVSELESLAEELQLKAALGESYKRVRAGKKDDFITALLQAPGVTYAGLVPQALRYPRRDPVTATESTTRAMRSTEEELVQAG